MWHERIIRMDFGAVVCVLKFMYENEFFKRFCEY